MNITIDSNIQNIIMRLGGVDYPISKLKLLQNGNESIVWDGGGPSHDYSQDYFTIESLEDGNQISFKRTNTNDMRDLRYFISLDEGLTWQVKSGDNLDITITLNAGKKMLMRCQTNKWSNSINNGYFYFSSTKTFNVYGNIMSMLYGDNFVGQTTLNDTYVFQKFFYNCNKLVSAENLVLPADTLTESCYNYMFYCCSSMTTAPNILATTLGNRSCYYMFYGCSSMTTAPELKATTLNGTLCCAGMFANCSSMTTAPELKATTLTDNCYQSMFLNCISLTAAPDLLATTLANYCYQSMFSGCTYLNYIKCLATSGINNTNCSLWLRNVAATGTFVKASSASWSTGASGIPSGWTVQNA